MLISEKQKQILSFPTSGYEALICDGAVRSGKTAWMGIAFIIWAMKAFSGYSFAFCGKSVGAVERNIVQPLLSVQYLRRNFGMQYNRSRRALVIKKGNIENCFYLFGGKDESSYMLIQGITLAGVLLDEVALMPRSFVEQALSRCSVAGSKYWFNCNPEGQMHWFNQEWILQAEKHNALHLHFGLDDNPSLTEEIKERYRNTFSGVFYQRYILGQWVAAEGLVYDQFDQDLHVIHYEPETEGECYVSCDYGIQNATVFLLWECERGTGRWIATDEWYYSGRDQKKQKTNAELAQGLADMLNGRDPRCVIADPSAASLKVELRKVGYRTRDADNDVLNGIADVGTMLTKGRIAFSERCKHTIEEFGVYVWDEKASLHGIDRPTKENDHCMDAVRYFVKTRKLANKEGRHMPSSVFAYGL